MKILNKLPNTTLDEHGVITVNEAEGDGLEYGHIYLSDRYTLCFYTATENMDRIITEVDEDFVHEAWKHIIFAKTNRCKWTKAEASNENQDESQRV